MQVVTPADGWAGATTSASARVRVNDGWMQAGNEREQVGNERGQVGNEHGQVGNKHGEVSNEHGWVQAMTKLPTPVPPCKCAATSIDARMLHGQQAQG